METKVSERTGRRKTEAQLPSCLQYIGDVYKPIGAQVPPEVREKYAHLIQRKSRKSVKTRNRKPSLRKVSKSLPNIKPPPSGQQKVKLRNLRQRTKKEVTNDTRMKEASQPTSNK